MSKEQKKTLYSGTLVALAQEIEEFHGVVALRLHKTGRSYPMVLFGNACYTQFGPKCVGKKIVWAREVTKAELRTESDSSGGGCRLNNHCACVIYGRK